MDKCTKCNKNLTFWQQLISVADACDEDDCENRYCKEHAKTELTICPICDGLYCKEHKKQHSCINTGEDTEEEECKGCGYPKSKCECDDNNPNEEEKEDTEEEDTENENKRILEVTKSTRPKLIQR